MTQLKSNLFTYLTGTLKCKKSKVVIKGKMIKEKKSYFGRKQLRIVEKFVTI